jgi:hypothetical protein
MFGFTPRQPFTPGWRPIRRDDIAGELLHRSA